MWLGCMFRLRSKYSIDVLKLGVEETKRLYEENRKEDLRVDKESYSIEFVDAIFDDYKTVLTYEGSNRDNKDATNKVIEQVLNSLSEQERRIIQLKYRDDITYEQIANKLGITINQARYIRNKAIVKLHNNIEIERAVGKS